MRSQLLRRRPLGHGRSWCRRQRIVGEEHRARLEEGQVVVAATEIADHRSEQPGQQRGAQIGTGFRQRVDDLVQSATLVVGRHTHHIKIGDRREREAQHLDESACSQREVDRTSCPLASGQPTADRRGRDNRLDRVEPDQPADLFDIVVRILQVRPPARRSDRQGVATVSSRSRRRPAAAVPPRSDRHRCRESAPEACRRSSVLGRPGHRAAYRLLRQQRATRMLHEELGDPMARGVAGLGVDPPLEPPGRLRRQLVTSRGARNRHRIEVGSLDDDIAGARRELGRGSAHHTGEADGSGGVGDQEDRRDATDARRRRESSASRPRPPCERRSRRRAGRRRRHGWADRSPTSRSW